MMLWVFRSVIIFGVLTAAYIALGIFNRWNHRRKLSQLSPEEVRDEMAAYDKSLKKRSLIGIYLIPVAVIGILLTAALLT